MTQYSSTIVSLATASGLLLSSFGGALAQSADNKVVETIPEPNIVFFDTTSQDEHWAGVSATGNLYCRVAGFVPFLAPDSEANGNSSWYVVSDCNTGAAYEGTQEAIEAKAQELRAKARANAKAARRGVQGAPLPSND